MFRATANGLVFKVAEVEQERRVIVSLGVEVGSVCDLTEQEGQERRTEQLPVLILSYCRFSAGEEAEKGRVDPRWSDSSSSDTLLPVTPAAAPGSGIWFHHSSMHCSIIFGPQSQIGLFLNSLKL